jgi:hypothetical protein
VSFDASQNFIGVALAQIGDNSLLKPGAIPRRCRSFHAEHRGEQAEGSLETIIGAAGRPSASTRSTVSLKSSSRSEARQDGIPADIDEGQNSFMTSFSQGQIRPPQDRLPIYRREPVLFCKDVVADDALGALVEVPAKRAADNSLWVLKRDGNSAIFDRLGIAR